MKISLWVLCVATTILFSCHKEETKEGISGTWNVVHASGTVAGIHQDYPKGDITWSFGDKLVIENKYTGNLNFGQPSGTYTYEVKKNSKEGDELYLSGRIFSNIIKLTSDSLVLFEQHISDGVRLILVR